MKKILTLLLAFAVAGTFVCFGANENIKVTGKNAPADGAVVRLIDKLSDALISSSVVSKGGFELKGKAEKDALLLVTVDGVEWDFLFFNDGKPVQLNVRDKTVTGSSLNSKLSECSLKNAAAYDAYYSFIEAFTALPAAEQEAKGEEFMSQYRSKLKEYADFYMGMMEENKDNLIPVAFIEHLPSVVSAVNEWDKTKGDKVLNDLLASGSPCARHPYVLDFKRKMDEADARRASAEAERRAAEAKAQSFVGQKFQDLEMADVNAKTHRLSEYVGKGKWVLVDFWAAWCNPCKLEMPNVVEAYKKYHDRGFEIVGLSFDRNKEDWVRAIREWDMPWVHLSDLKYWQSVAVGTYNVTGIPDNLLIDPEGKVVARGLRGKALEAMLAEIYK